MIVGFGTDICENERIAYMLRKYGDRFLNRIYAREELDYCSPKKDPIPHLTARFALKEAFIKSLQLDKTRGLSYKEVYLWGSLGKKEIQLTGRLRKLYDDKDVNHIWFCISHAKNYSTASVLLERNSS